MDIRIFQVNEDRDDKEIAFMGYDHAITMGIDPYCYDIVYDGEIQAQNLEEIFVQLNTQLPEGYVGRSMSVSDVCEVNNNGASEYYYCDSTGFKKIDFDASQARQMKEETITVIACQPGQKAEIIEFPNTLEAKQKFVGGYIEAIYPFSDPVAIICNEEGKMNRLELNRALYTEDGDMYDIVAGPMLICGLSADDFTSLHGEFLDKYQEKFQKPEAFVRIGNDILAIKLPEEQQQTNRQTQSYKHK